MGCQAVVSTNKESQHQQAYIELRAEAALHAKLRAENFMKAAHARGQKQWEVAQYYAHQVCSLVGVVWVWLVQLPYHVSHNSY